MKSYLYERYDILVTILSVYLTEFLLRAVTGMDLFTVKALLFDACYLLVLAAVLAVVKRPYRSVIEVIVVTFFSLLAFAQAVHYNFFDNFFTFRKLSLIEELANVKAEVLVGIQIADLLFIIPIVLIVLCIIFHKKKEDKTYWEVRVLTSLVIAIVAVATQIALVHALEADYLIDRSWNRDYYLYEQMQDRIRYLDTFGLIDYVRKDTEVTLSVEKKRELTDEEEEAVADFIADYSERTDNDYSGIFEGKNLVLILCESFDESAIDPILTPTLYMLATEGWYFSEHYAPIFEVATGDSEFISQTGMLPSIDNGTTSYTYDLNSYPYALANLFKEAGYNANSYHSYTGNFYNRESLHESLGFSTFYDMDKLGLESYEGGTDAYNWVLDEELFAAVLENTPFDDDAPFFDFIVTVSGHHPYNSDRFELAEYYEIVEATYPDIDEQAKWYLAAQMSLDRGIAVLLEGLAEEGVLDDTVIYLFADHYPYGVSSTDARTTLFGDVEDYEYYRVPMIIYSTDTEAEVFDTLSSTFDIYPTICNLFGLDDSSAYKVGHDVFDEEALRYVVFLDRSFLTEYFYYDSGSTDIPEGYEDIYDSIAIKIEEIFEYSQLILLGDYYADG